MRHVASGAEETRAAMADLVIENLRAFFADGRLKTRVHWSPNGCNPRGAMR